MTNPNLIGQCFPGRTKTATRQWRKSGTVQYTSTSTFPFPLKAAGERGGGENKSLVLGTRQKTFSPPGSCQILRFSSRKDTISAVQPPNPKEKWEFRNPAAEGQIRMSVYWNLFRGEYHHFHGEEGGRGRNVLGPLNRESPRGEEDPRNIIFGMQNDFSSHKFSLLLLNWTAAWT